MQKEQQLRYFTPTERRAMMNALVLLSQEEIDLAGQVEKSLAKEGVIVPGSLQNVPPVSPPVSKILSHIKNR